MTQVSQHAKFRWTENLTCRFIQLRKENGKLFTGRKYSAQAGWEYILQQMREEFPTIMANVHYRVLKKKWSNLLQQYKELKNPVHGDRNKANDVSWPFYNAIDEVLGYDRGTTPINDEYIDPHEFLCVSVTPEEPTSSVNALPAQSDPEIEHRTNDSFPEQRLRALSANCSIEVQKVRPSGVSKYSGTSNRGKQMVRNSARRKRYTKNALMSQLPRATELTIEKVTSEADCSKDLFRLRASDVASNRDKERAARNEDEERPRKSQRSLLIPYRDDHETQTDRRIEQIFEYIKRRDEENRSIMVRVMHAVESIANKL
ncbi:PREDICTED: uncharacterized protein LOC108551818 isoform X2 [Eufriesea mexicana]|uniref:uncharacterized protein LOC108551818 isoform X2 n=1 Tax=Eufriesea mexicana TaxID=516756 RepID=UPI00083BB27D|nr:PREDICTED: uncharacterized protein LOC108551818 isoform X2 [Eufriesea mexicana]